jgi:2-(1,2-epoxy-1,2-dihydrophenyl)acetyl-CoA isomerase
MSVRTEVAEGVLTVTLDRPEKLNAFDAAMAQGVREAMERAAADDAIRVVLLAANGRAFCAGQDLADSNVTPGSDLGEMLEKHYNPLIRAMRELPKPIVARVNGVAAGAGANVVFAADIAIAARSASFIESFAKIGLLPDSGGTWMLPRLIGAARAAAVALLGEKVTAEQAHAWGAIWQVVDDAELDAACARVTSTLAAAAPRALAAIKHALQTSWSSDLDSALDRERDAQRMLGASADYREGVEAFSAKRRPVFSGR